MNDERFWLDHLKAIDASGLTTKAYGEQHNLSVKKLYQWRKRFRTEGVSAVPASSQVIGNPFMAVSVKPVSSEAVGHCVLQCGSIRLELDRLPSVQWLVSLDVAFRRAG
jgi:hypothetical protein